MSNETIYNNEDEIQSTKFKNKIWVVSDLHFFHRGIIGHSRKELAVKDENGKYDRDASVEVMHNKIIESWNKYVGKDDIVIDLGDVCFGNKTAEELKPLFDKMNGKRILLKGNHDYPILNKDPEFFKKLGYKNIEEWFVNMTINNDKLLPWMNKEKKDKINFKGVIFSHAPMEIIPEGYVNLHGHVHNGTSQHLFALDERRINAAIDTRDYTPLLLWDPEY